MTMHAPLSQQLPTGLSPYAIAGLCTTTLIGEFYKEDFQSLSISLGWREILKNEVLELALECSHENWDGEGALPITEYEKKVACRFIDLLPEGIEPPFITPENTGDIAFDWDIRKNMTFAVILTENNAIYAGIFDGDRRRGEIGFNYEEIPIPINDILVKFFGK